jgi:hypothetical protein
MIPLATPKGFIKTATCEGLPLLLSIGGSILGAGCALALMPIASFVAGPLLGLAGLSVGAVIRRNQLGKDVAVENRICVKINKVICEKNYSGLREALEILVENSFNRKFIQKVAHGIAHACLADRDSPDGQKLLNYANNVARGEFLVGKAKASRTMIRVLNKLKTTGSGNKVPAIVRDASTSSQGAIWHSLHRDALLSSSPTNLPLLDAPFSGTQGDRVMIKQPGEQGTITQRVPAFAREARSLG